MGKKLVHIPSAIEREGRVKMRGKKVWLEDCYEDTN